MESFDPDFTPDLYDLDGDNSFDFDNEDLGGQMIGSLPGLAGDTEQHEKRKNPDENASPEAGDAKRQETQEGEKGAKKPGRKPLTNEPTTKRKAQNRAAQRAFRERKEKHLKDLETQVSELTKTQEADKHENGLLRAQVDRLQVELREYRKRLSLNSGGANRSPPMSAGLGASARNSMSFQFDFPKFGSLPTTQILPNDNASITPPLSNHSPVTAGSGRQSSHSTRHNSEGRSMSPSTAQNQFSNSRSPSLVSNVGNASANTTNFAPFSTNDNMHGFASTLPQMGKNGNDPFGDLFSPSILKSVANNSGSNSSYFASPGQIGTSTANETATFGSGNGGDSTAGLPDHRVFRFNSGSASDSASPSTSSLSQWNNNTSNSSCGTSPEPANDSPATKTKSLDTINEKLDNAASYSFTELPAQSISNDLGFGSIDANAYSVPQVDTFDPVLFGDYRDTNDNVVGGGDFTGGFFDDSINSAPIDFGSPTNLFGILTEPSATPSAGAPTPSRALMAQMDATRDGEEPAVNITTGSQQQTDKSGKMISCTNIWNQLQSNPDFQDGKFDLDGLCSELRTKARCSESGLMVDSEHVDQALRRMTSKTAPEKRKGHLMFEQESWDNVLKKMNAAKQ